MKTSYQRLHDDCAMNMKIQYNKDAVKEITRMNTISKERCEYCGKLINASHKGAQYKIEYKI